MTENAPGPGQAVDAEPAYTEKKKDPHGLVGKSIAHGRYEVDSVIGIGGMGVVYRGRQAAVDRTVAIKVLMPQMADDESLIKRFHLEARAASRLTHPNTITIHDFGREGELLYIVMEFLEGESLHEVLKNQGHLESDRVCHIISQTCSSLAEAHANGIIHRDIKPDNIFLKTVGSQRDFVKVLDFGVAKLRDPGVQDATMTQAGMIFGTPKYMSPEQAKAKKLDGRTDLYALGVVMYECLMGRVPFLAQDPVSILIQHVHDTPPPFREIRPDLDVPEELEAVVMRVLSKDPDDRFINADEMRQAIDGVTASITAAQYMSGLSNRTPSPRPYSPAPSPDPGATVLTRPVPGREETPPPFDPHAAETIVASKPREEPTAVSEPSRDATGTPGLDNETWSGNFNLAGTPGTQMVRVGPGVSKTLLSTVLILGIVLLGGIGFLLYEMILAPTEPTEPAAVEAGEPVEAAGPERGPTEAAPGGGAEGAAPVQPGAPSAAPPEGAAAGGAGAEMAMAGEAPGTPESATGAEPAGPAGPGLPAEGMAGAQAVVADDLIPVRITARPDDATFDFGDRAFERDPSDESIFLFRRSDGEVLNFTARADGYRSREVEQSLSESGDGPVEVEVRLRRERSEERRDPCVDPRTGLRDPYCTR